MRVLETLVAACAAAMVMAVAVHAVEDRFYPIPPPEPCRPNMTSCEFWLHIVVALTGINMKKNEPNMTVPYNGNMYDHSPTNDYTGETPVNLSYVIAADGYPDSRMLYLVNGSLPGPTLTVYHGQNITVYIKNHLTEAETSIHFHGIMQHGTPYADGVSFVTQCPISPGQTFAHNFKITQPGGTHWYHAHAGNQRTMGIYGAFIIKNKPEPNKPEPKEHVLLLQDYNHDWSSEMHFFKSTFGLYKGTEKTETTKSHDGGLFSGFSFQSGLINGLGRWYDPKKPNTPNGAPLSKFEVKQGDKYRLRVIAAGTLYPFRFSVDEHELTVVATDGFDVDPDTVESFIINPGERYDVMLEANQAVKNYMIRAQTLEVGVNHIAEAILNYKTVNPYVEPTTSRRACTAAKPCKVLNCPFKYYPKGSNTECINVGQLRGKKGGAPKAEGSSYKQFFLNFAFPGRDLEWFRNTSEEFGFPGRDPDWFPGSVNGRAFHHPQVNPLAQMDEMVWGCDPKKNCGEKNVCSCTYHVDIDFGDTVQMVFLNMGYGKGWAHPIHMHGHSFYVVKQGFGQYDSTTGNFTKDNSDIRCLGKTSETTVYCNNATWSDDTWVNDNIPGLNLKNPPLKDTIIVPSGGYVIIRFKADNPGVWIMHCHIELHNTGGMAMLVREGKDKIPKPPKGYPTCRNFDHPGGYAPQESNCLEHTDGGLIAGVFFGGFGVGAIVLGAVIAVICCCCLSRNKADSAGSSQDNQQTATTNKAFEA